MCTESPSPSHQAPCLWHKRCWACKRQLPTSAFYANRTTQDGLSSECRECRRSRYPAKSSKKSAHPRRHARKQHTLAQRWKHTGPVRVTRKGRLTKLGRHILSLLLRKALTQREIAWVSGVSPQTVGSVWRLARLACPSLKRHAYQNHVHRRALSIDAACTIVHRRNFDHYDPQKTAEIVQEIDIT